MEIVEKEPFINNLIIFVQVTWDSVIDETWFDNYSIIIIIIIFLYCLSIIALDTFREFNPTIFSIIIFHSSKL